LHAEAGEALQERHPAILYDSRKADPSRLPLRQARHFGWGGAAADSRGAAALGKVILVLAALPAKVQRRVLRRLLLARHECLSLKLAHHCEAERKMPRSSQMPSSARVEP